MQSTRYNSYLVSVCMVRQTTNDMKVLMTQNGNTTMYLSPETEIEKLLLQSLFSGAVDARHHSTVQVGGKALVDAVEITPFVAAKDNPQQPPKPTES